MIKKRNFKKYKFFIYLFSLLSLSCASKQKALDSVFEDRPFLNEYKTYALTSGIGNAALDVAMDTKGRWVYFSRERFGNTDVYAVDSYTLDSYRLTRSPGIDQSVSIDSKSRYLVFSSTRDDAFSDIYMYKLTRYGLKKSVGELESLEQNIIRLTSYKGYDIEPKISHNGELVAFVSYRENNTPYIYTMRNSGKDVVRRSDIPSKTPSFSFNDRYIVFSTVDVGNKTSQIAILDLNLPFSSNTVVLTDSETFKFDPVFYNDDTIIYFEVDDIQNTGDITYSSKRKLISFSLSTGESYVLSEDTELTKFYVAYPSAAVGAYISYLDGFGNVIIGSTKPYFIKDENANIMYNTFSALPYDRQIEKVNQFQNYFTAEEDKETVAKSYFDIMCKSYTNGNYKNYEDIKKVILSNYTNTLIGKEVLNIEEAVFYKNIKTNTVISTNRVDTVTNSFIQEVKPIDNTETVFILKEAILSDVLVWSKYITASELIKKGGWKNNGEALDLLEDIINIEPSDKNLYILVSKLYTRALILNNISYYDNSYNTPYRNNNISFSDKLNIAKQFVIDSNYDYERLIESFSFEHIVSLATRLIYLDSLIISGSSDTASSIFENYLNSKNNVYKSFALYAYGKIHIYEKNDSAYSEFVNAIDIGGRDFNETEEAKEIVSILSSYYRTLADTAYNDGRHTVSYENYRQVLKYNPDDSIAAVRVMESALKSFSDISSLEETIKNRESIILKTRYSDHTAHAELASTYYYLASRYYSLAIEKEKSKDRYLIHDKRREDAFYYYLNKSFTSITEDAVSYIDFAIFLNPDNTEYYIKKAEMLSFAQGIQMQVLQDDKTSKSILEILPTYSQDNKSAAKYFGYSKLSFKTTDIDGAIINSLIEAKRRVSKDNTKLSLMLANAYLVNGRYIDASKEYQNASVILNETESKKTLAWYHFFYGYSLWMNNDVENAFKNYEKAKELFLSLGDRETVYRVVGYSAVAAIDNNNYQKAIEYLLERQKFIEEYKIEDELNDLLLAVSYLKVEDYNNALLYCDRAKELVDGLNSEEYNPNYLSLTFFGANFNLLNMGLASLGGYIPGEPLNIDKQQMLYSLYQELYEKTGRYTESRNALAAYKDYVIKDKPKESIKPLMLATYMNNEGYLYYRQGNDAEAIKSFKSSIDEFRKTVKTEEESYKNAANDVKNYLSLSSLYLRYLSMGSFTNFKLDFYRDLKDVTDHLKVLLTNSAVTPKDKLLIQTHIAGSEYILAFKIASDSSIYNVISSYDRISSKRKDNINAEELINYDRNVYKLMLLRDAINRYEYILSKNSNYPVDLKTEIIIRYNLAKSYELAGYIENAAREYLSAYSKAKNSMFAVEEIAILTTMIDFSGKYQERYPDSIDKQEEYVKRIMARLRESVFMITFVEDGNYILRNSKDALINYYGLNNPNESINVLAIFDTLDLRRKFLDERLYTLGRNNAYLQRYYNMYEKALISHQKYLDSVATYYNKKEEEASLNEIRELEKEARTTFKNTPIAAIAIGDIDRKLIENSMRKDETLIWDTPQGIRFIKEQGVSLAYFTTNDLITTKSYVTHIGEKKLFISNSNLNNSITNSISTNGGYTNSGAKAVNKYTTNNIITNNNLFIREIKDITSYILPAKTSLMIPTLYSASKITKEYDNAVAPTYTFITNITKITNEYIVTNYKNTNYQNTNYKETNTNYVIYTYKSNSYITNVLTITNESIKFNFINIDTLISNPYAPVFVDMTDVSTQQIKKLAEKRLYVVYVNRNIYEQNIETFNLMDPIAIVVGENATLSRAVFYSNYFTNMQTKTLEDAMLGYNRELFTIYGKPDTTISAFNASVKTFKATVLTTYKNTKTDSSKETLIRYAESEEEKLDYYKMFLEDSILAKDYNTAQNMADLGFNLIISNKAIKETNAYTFMKLYPSAFRAVTNESIVLRNANRVLLYVSNYTNTKTDIISDYFTVFNLSRFLRSQKNTATAANYIDLISSNVRGVNREKILEMSIIYHTLYAKSDTNRLSYYLNEAKNGYKTLEIANVINAKPETLTNDKLIFEAMNYIYANQLFFIGDTVSYFADTFYKKYSTNPAYIFGLLEKSRIPESNFEDNIKDATEVFNNESTNTMFMFYTIDNSKYTLYSYLVGDTAVKKNIFALSKRVAELNTNFIKAASSDERIKALETLDKELINKNIQADILKAKKIYITGSYQVFNIPFAYLPSFNVVDTVKVKEIKYGNNNINKIESSVDFALLREKNFYSDIEEAGVNTFKYSGENKYPFTHYAGETNITDFKSDVFLSPITSRDLFYYLRSQNDTRLFFTYKYSDTGDYFYTMKKLYSGFDKGIIEAYREIRSLKREKIQSITLKDNSIYYAASESLFDYILPYIPKAN